jgi:hypothetical protein
MDGGGGEIAVRKVILRTAGEGAGRGEQVQYVMLLYVPLPPFHTALLFARCHFRDHPF